MINPPDGFDARTFPVIQLSSLGIHRKLVKNYSLIRNNWSVHPKKEAALRLLSARKYLLLEGNTTFSCLLIKAIC